MNLIYITLNKNNFMIYIISIKIDRQSIKLLTIKNENIEKMGNKMMKNRKLLTFCYHYVDNFMSIL